jgi:hypothetical protein
MCRAGDRVVGIEHRIATLVTSGIKTFRKESRVVEFFPTEIEVKSANRAGEEAGQNKLGIANCH